MRPAWLASLMVAALASGYQAPSPQGAEARKKPTYLVVYRPGPAWIAGKPLTEQPLKEHGKYMLSLYTRGTLKFAGPFLDDGGGAVVFEAENPEEAKAVVSADPAVSSQVFVGELHPWKLVDWEQRARK